jgi:hypothetical protein
MLYVFRAPGAHESILAVTTDPTGSNLPRLEQRFGANWKYDGTTSDDRARWYWQNRAAFDSIIELLGFACWTNNTARLRSMRRPAESRWRISSMRRPAETRWRVSSRTIPDQEPLARRRGRLRRAESLVGLQGRFGGAVKAQVRVIIPHLFLSKHLLQGKLNSYGAEDTSNLQFR